MTGGSSGDHHVDLKLRDNSEAEDALRAAEAVRQLAMQQISEEAKVSQELLVYPEGEVDAVTITERDVEELQAGKFLGNHIVDFYIRFLARGLSPEHGDRLYFFNSFFFTKLLQSTAPTGLDPCKVDYEQLRMWTKEVNLFSKDYVFIPILTRSHWSLVIICHLSSLTRPPGETMRPPCVVHLDPIEGQHESFEGLIRSYVLQAWMNRFEVSSDKDQLLALCQMKYVKTKVPEQDNFHDCGLHVLHYIEAFLMKPTSSHFNSPSCEMVPQFIGLDFEREVLGKRRLIQNLIHELSGISQERARMHRAIQEVVESTQNLRSLLSDEDGFEACIKDVQIASPISFNGQGSKINHASFQEDPLNPQVGRTTLVSRGELLNSAHIGPTKYEDRSESFLPKQQYAELMLQTSDAPYFNDSISVAKHASTLEDAIEVSHQQPNGILELHNEELEGPKVLHVQDEGVKQDIQEHVVFEEVPCIDMFEVPKGRNKRGRNMTNEETWVLLSCKVQRSHFCKGGGRATDWKLISEEIGKQLGSWPSADQCRLRYDTLLKAYKTYKEHCVQTGKTFSSITGPERLKLKLATTLREEWYTTLDNICSMGNVCQKRMKPSSNACIDLHPLGSLALSPLPAFKGKCVEDEAVELDSVPLLVESALRNVIPVSVFNYFNKDLQSTLLNLVQESFFIHYISKLSKRAVFELEVACRRLAIVQDREPREILDYVFKLWKLDLVKVEGMVFEEGYNLAHLYLWEAKTWFVKWELYDKILKEVLCKNPQFQTYWRSYPFEQSPTQYIRVLTLFWYAELEHLDLIEFPSLQYLVIKSCQNLNMVTGWEVPTGLASLQIRWCNLYLDFPEVRYFPSLKEVVLQGRKSSKSRVPWQLSQFSQCSKLQRLEIWDDESLSEVADLESLKELKFLECLHLENCSFSSIRGLSGLQALTTLKVIYCYYLKEVPNLGCLKGLTHLDMSRSGVEHVVGVGELHLLTSLRLGGCKSLKWLPFLGHLKALIYLNLCGTSVKEILGRENLINLKTLDWDFEEGTT